MAIIGFWSIGIVVLFTCTDIVSLSIMIIPYIFSFAFMLRLLSQLKTILHYTGYFHSENLGIYLTLQHLSVIFMVVCGVVIVIQLIATILI